VKAFLIKLKENAMKLWGKGGPGSFKDILLADLVSGKKCFMKIQWNNQNIFDLIIKS
jgi:hypothetical protein